MYWLRGQDLNLRPSGYEPDELPGCSTPRHQGYGLFWSGRDACFSFLRRLYCPLLFCGIAFNRPGSDLLSRVLRRSTIGAGAFHGRVRNGNGCGRPAMTTRSIKGNVMRSWQALPVFFLNTSFLPSPAGDFPYRPIGRRQSFGAPSAVSRASRDSVRTEEMAHRFIDEHYQ